MTHAVLFVALLLQAPADDARGSITGRCISAETGQGITGVQLTLEVEKQKFSRSTLSGPDGVFSFERLSAGSYALNAERTGYERAQEFPISIRIEPAQTRTGVELRFHRRGVISGTVTDPDGQPVIGAWVMGYRVVWSEGRQFAVSEEQTSTDDRGSYRLFGLSPGRYIVAALGPSEGNGAPGEMAMRLMSYYPSGFRPSDAARVRVRWGQEASDVNLVLHPVEGFSISGHIVDAATGGPCRNCMLRINRAEELDDFVQRRGSLAPDGGYRVGGLAAGAYRLSVEKPASDRHHTVSSRVVAVQNRDLRNVDLVAGVERNLSGRVVLDSLPEGVDPKRWPMRVILRERGSFRGMLSVEPDLSFESRGLAAGPHRIRVVGGVPGGYLKKLRLAGRELPGSDVEVPEEGSVTELEAVVAFDSATLSGTVKPPDPSGSGHRVTAGGIILLPQDNQFLLSVRSSVSNGTFSITGIPPGSYLAFALPASDPPEVQDPEVRRRLLSYGKAVELGPGQKVSIELVLADVE